MRASCEHPTHIRHAPSRMHRIHSMMFFMLPHDDFGPSKNRRVRPFVSTFHTPNYSIWANSDENRLQNELPAYFSTFPNLRLGAIVANKKVALSALGQNGYENRR